jgi:ABC-2 type transport system ATP-binding protein
VASTITVSGLAKSYGRVQALRGVSFTVGRGEIFALLGPNGAGKTTTLEILEGFRGRDGGQADVLGLDPGDRATGRALRERIGLVLQDIAVEPYLTVRETIARNAGYYPAPRRVDEVITLVGLAGQERTKVRNLSGGRKRRLDLGLGLIGDPELLFLDEPTTGFDPAARRDAWQLVRSLRDSGTTILLTTHYMEEAQALADRVAVLSDGQVVAQGTLADIGGRAAAQTQIRFALPGGCVAADLPAWARPGAAPAAGPEPGDLVAVAVSEPTRALHELTTWALHRGLVLDQLTVEPPSLEDVYLRLTGPGRAATTDGTRAGGRRTGRKRAGERTLT